MSLIAQAVLGERPDPFVVEPKGEHRQTVVLLHGTSSCGEVFGGEFVGYRFWGEGEDSEVEDGGWEGEGVTLRGGWGSDGKVEDSDADWEIGEEDDEWSPEDEKGGLDHTEPEDLYDGPWDEDIGFGDDTYTVRTRYSA